MLSTSSPITSLSYSTKDPYLIAGGCYSGQVSRFTDFTKRLLPYFFPAFIVSNFINTGCLTKNGEHYPKGTVLRT